MAERRPSAAAEPDRSSLLHRTPPQDLEAEMALLGSMMMSRDVIGEVVPIIGRQDVRWFYQPAHQKLFEVLLDLYDEPGQAIDLLVVADELRRRELLQFVGGQDYMIRLAESFANWANAEHYARLVRDKGMLRDLIRCATEISDYAYSVTDKPRDIFEKAEQRFHEVTERRVSGESKIIKDVIAKLVSRLEDRQDGAVSGLQTGFRELDKMTTGFQPGDLVIVAARPSMGKTALGLNMAQYAAMEDRQPIAFFSMEMSAEQLAQRLACAYAGVDAHKLRSRMLDEMETKRLLNACAAFEDAPMYIDDTPGMTALELRSKARRLRQLHGVKAVFVDYLQLMHVPGTESRQAEIAAISRGLKSLGRELEVPIIAMAQLNRLAEGRQDKRPIMSDLRESGAIEQDADVVLLIHREEYYRRDDESVKGIAELIIAKQRNGPVGKVELQFNPRNAQFHNLEMVPHLVSPADYDDAPF